MISTTQNFYMKKNEKHNKPKFKDLFLEGHNYNK